MLISAMQHNFQLSLIPWKSETGSRVCHNLMVLSALDTVALPNSIGGVLINIDLDRLASLAFKNSSSTLYMVYEDRIIASSDAACFFVDLSAVPALEKAHRSQIVSSDGYHVHTLVNPTYGYTLYSLQEHAVLMTPVITGLLVLILIISGLLVVTLLLSRHAALHAYTPVKTILIQLEEQLPGAAEAEDGLNDLQRASHSIRRASEIVSAYRRDADTARLGRFIHNGNTEPRIAEIFLQHLGFNDEQPLYMLLIQAASLEDAHLAADVVQGSLSGYARFLTLDMPGQRLLSLIVPIAADNAAQTIVNSVDQVLQLMRSQNQGKVIMALEKADCDVESLPEAYIRLTERMRSSVFCQQSTFLAQPVQGDILEALSLRLQQAMLNQDEATLHETMTAYLHSCSQVSAREAYHQLATLCMRVTEAGSRRGFDMSDRLDSYHSIFNTLFSLPDYEAMTGYISHLHQTVLRSIDARNADENNPLADSILAYMNAHFNDPALSAAQVADALNVSVSHLSRVMNRSVGCGFPEALQTIRLEHACGILIDQPNIAIAQLAQQCGFSSASYFTASFKKKYGVTPSSYRQKRAMEE